MHSIEQSVEVEVPVRTAYDQWTQFEEFPRFMQGVDEVRQLDDTHLHWKATIGGKTHEWDAEITEQLPDDRIAWRSTDGKTNAGVVTFHRLDESRTKVMLQLDWESEGMLEALGSAVGSDDRRVRGDLERFKELIESRGVESGAWRGEVRQTS
ncbi:MAG TPA: SRPBCC family protein [Gaiellaceae bacterium]|nr:SRPBCC family protein [Gaiellaceae bacterium]